MKIFPPLSEMLWPPGRSVQHNIQRRALPAIVVLSTLFIGPLWLGGAVSPDPDVTACTAGPACEPGSWKSTKRLSNTPTGSLLKTPAEFQLTPSDRAIKRPQEQLRPSVWQNGTIQTKQPAIASSETSAQ